MCFADKAASSTTTDILNITAAAKTTLSITGGTFAQKLNSFPATENLILRAQHALEKHTRTTLPATFLLTKNIPLGSGLGGGSANAAAALRGLNTVYDLGLSFETLQTVGANVGADVPVCIASRPCIMRGVGEQLTPQALPAPLFIVLVTPPISVATAAVFQAWHKETEGVFSAPLHMSDVENTLALIEFLNAHTHNALTSAAVTLFPIIAEILETLKAQQDCLLAHMSGSGSTCFALFPTMDAANVAAKIISTARQEWWVQAVTSK